MNNVWDEVMNALSTARSINHAADQSANAMAQILHGRLRHVSSTTLVALKRELHGFNAVSREWKS